MYSYFYVFFSIVPPLSITEIELFFSQNIFFNSSTFFNHKTERRPKINFFNYDMKS